MAIATYKIFKLHFTSPLHIADRHEDESNSMKTIQSDTLYAALISCLAKTGVAMPEDGDLGFTISSLFPYFQRGKDDNPIYFLPMPMQASLSELADVSMAKKVKRIQWIDSELYTNVLTGDRLFDGSDKYIPYIQESYLTKRALPEDTNGSKEFVMSEVSQRVTLNSRTGDEDAKPYYVDKVIFRYESGLYFIAEGDTELLEKALNLLAIEGVGTDRNVGFGFFEYTSNSLCLNIPEDADHQIALSLLIPESKEQLGELLASDNVAYDFTRRGGWITTYPFTTLRKNAIYGFLPGSVFSKTNEPSHIIGKIVDLRPEIGELTPDHPVWRCGKSIMVPIKLK
jgi:CRISPR-associated protein Csm4